MRPRTVSSSHHLTPFGGDSDEEEPRDDYTVPQKVRYHSHWKRNQDAAYWVKKSRAQDQGLQFWQMKSHAVIVNDPVPADCIYRVISQSGDRILFERLNPTTRAKSHTERKLAIAAAAAAVCHDVTGARRLVRESQCGTRDVRGNTTDDQTCTRRLVRNLEPAVRN